MERKEGDAVIEFSHEIFVECPEEMDVMMNRVDENLHGFCD